MENENVKEKSLAFFGARSELRELADRVKLMVVGGKKLDGHEAIILAQLAMAHGLDPFNGEVWYIPNSGPMVGIKGLRKMARRQAGEENGSFWIKLEQVDPAEFNEPESSVVYVAKLFDTVSTTAWSKSVNQMVTAGIPYNEAVDMLGGGSPVTMGVGIAKSNESSKMGIHARARKRAEADAIKIRYDVEFAGAGPWAGIVDPGSEPDFTFDPINGAFVDDNEKTNNGETRTSEQVLTELGY